MTGYFARPERRFFSRKRKLFILIAVLFLILFLLPVNAVSSHAEEADSEGQEKLEQSIEELLASLDLKDLQAYLDSLSQFQGTSLKEKLASVINGDFSLDYSSLFDSVLALVWEEGKMLLPAFVLILAVSLVCGILNSAKSGFLQSSMSDIIHFVGYISVGSVTLSCLITVLNAGFSALSQMQRQMELVYPLLITLMAGSGGAVSAAVYRPAVAFMSGAITELFSVVVLPAAVMIIVLAFVGNLSNDVRTEKLGELFKSVSKWLIGLSLGLFSLFLTIQGITSAQYDGISLRAAKYAVSSSVPIVGGFLSGGLDLVLAGSALIKNALGSFAVFMLFATLLRPLVLLVVFQLFLRLAAAATEPVGGKTSAFLGHLAGDMGYFIAGILCVAFLYFLTLLLLICSSGVIF